MNQMTQCLRAFQWRLMLLWVLWMLIPTAILVYPLWHMLADSLDYSVHAASIAQQMDMTVFADLMAAHGRNALAIESGAIVALIATLLISPLLSGMAASAARAPETLGIKALTAGGLAEYPRMLRMLVWAVVPLGLAIAAGGAAMDWAAEHVETAVTAADERVWKWAAAILLALLLAIANASLDAGRAALAIERRRTSAVKAWWSGTMMLLRRPFSTLGVYFLISGTGLAIVAALSVARLNVPSASLAGFVGALLVTQLIVVAVAWMRSARLFAMVELARKPR
ncbi:MAG: hypothetical protein V4633_01630 [Pseudomonadota bacterium]